MLLQALVFTIMAVCLTGVLGALVVLLLLQICTNLCDTVHRKLASNALGLAGRLAVHAL